MHSENSGRLYRIDSLTSAITRAQYKNMPDWSLGGQRESMPPVVMQSKSIKCSGLLSTLRVKYVDVPLWEGFHARNS